MSKIPILAVIRGRSCPPGSANCRNFLVFAGPKGCVMIGRSRKCLEIQGKMNLAVPLLMVHGLTSARAIGILAALWVLRGP
jgi:hypothetical protein